MNKTPCTTRNTFIKTLYDLIDIHLKKKLHCNRFMNINTQEGWEVKSSYIIKTQSNPLPPPTHPSFLRKKSGSAYLFMMTLNIPRVVQIVEISKIIVNIVKFFNVYMTIKIRYN